MAAWNGVVSMALVVLAAAVCKVIGTAEWIRHLTLIVERLDGSIPGWIECAKGGHGVGYGICILNFGSEAWVTDTAPALLGMVYGMDPDEMGVDGMWWSGIGPRGVEQTWNKIDSLTIALIKH